jgi:hypothetical protein
MIASESERGGTQWWNDRTMSISSLGDKAVTWSVILAALGVVGWVTWMWLTRWWYAVNHR